MNMRINPTKFSLNSVLLLDQFRLGKRKVARRKKRESLPLYLADNLIVSLKTGAD
jgi:hypothetical protein